MKKNLMIVLVAVFMIFYAGTLFAGEISESKNASKAKDSLSEFDRFFQTLINDDTIISSAAGSVIHLSVVTQNRLQDMGKVKKGIAVVAGINLKF